MRSSSAPRSPAAPPRSTSAGPGTASRWWTSARTRRPTSASAATSSSPAPSPRSSGSACWRSSRRPAPCAGTRACGRRTAGSRSRTAPGGAASLSIRREKLDPLLRRRAAETPGVELMLGHALTGTAPARRAAAASSSRRGPALTTRLLVGADGRGSRTAALAGVRTRTSANARFAYWGYFEGPPLGTGASVHIWFRGRDIGIATPTDGGLMLYVAFPGTERAKAFKARHRGRAARVRRRAARRAADRRVAARRAARRQARPHERVAAARRPRARARRRRRARRRPGRRRRLRLGGPVGGVAGAGRLARPARRAPRCPRRCAPTAAATGASSSATR